MEPTKDRDKDDMRDKDETRDKDDIQSDDDDDFICRDFADKVNKELIDYTVNRISKSRERKGAERRAKEAEEEEGGEGSRAEDRRRRRRSGKNLSHQASADETAEGKKSKVI